MRAAALALAGVALAAATGCRTPLPAVPLPSDDPRPAALLAAWRVRAAERDSLHAVARLAVDAPGAGAGGADLALRSKQRLWLARPAKLRVEVLGFLDTALAVLTTDGEHYAWLQTADRSFDAGPVYEGLLWDVARLDLTPHEAVEVILGVPRPDADLAPGAAFARGGGVAVDLVDAVGRVRRVVEFDAAGELRRLEQRDVLGRRIWEARFDDYADVQGVRFARTLDLRGGADGARAELVLRRVELNPALDPALFRLSPPAEGG